MNLKKNTAKGLKTPFQAKPQLMHIQTYVFWRQLTKIICCKAKTRQEADAPWIDFLVLFVADLRLERISVQGGVVKWMFIV